MGKFDAFLEVEGIKGESKDSKFPHRIDILSFSFGVYSANLRSSGGEEPAGQVKVHDLHIVKQIDAASVPLFRACADGTKISKAHLIVRKAGGTQQEYFRMTMEDVYITSVTSGIAHGDEHPMEQVTLNFSKMTVKYAEQTERGTVGGPLVYTLDLAKGGS